MNRIQEIIDNNTGEQQKPNYVAIAKRMGVSTVTLRNWRLNITQPRFEQIPIVAQVLGCEIKDLFK